MSSSDFTWRRMILPWIPGPAMTNSLADLGANRLAWPAQTESPSKFSTPGRQSVRGYRERERGPFFLRETRSRTSYERGSETTRRGFLEPCLVTRNLLSNSRAKERFPSCTPSKTPSKGRSQGWEGEYQANGPQWTPMAHNRPACPPVPPPCNHDDLLTQQQPPPSRR